MRFQLRLVAALWLASLVVIGIFAYLQVVEEKQRLTAELDRRAVLLSEGLKEVLFNAADLTGKEPTDFEAITGTREVPTSAAPGTTADADLLASLDLDAINQAQDAASLAKHLSALLPARIGAGATEDEVLRGLWEGLSGKSYVNQLVREAAGQARALGQLAEAVFPGHAKSRRALEALRLYRRAGFHEISRRPGYYPGAGGAAATALILRRDLV